MKRWKSLLGVLLLFVVGFLSGMAFDRFAIRFRLAPGRFLPPLSSQSAVPPQWPAEFLAHIEANVVRELQLTAEQRKVLDSAIQDAQKQLEDLHRWTRPKVATILDEAQDKLLPVLTEEQKAALARMRRPGEDRIRRFESPQPPPPNEKR